MIAISTKDEFIDASATEINYNVSNPVNKLMKSMEDACFFAETFNSYIADSLEFLFPYSKLQIYGPSGDLHNQLDPKLQNVKTDFQKQNIKDFILTDTLLVRGWVTIGNETCPFIKISYTGGTDSALSKFSGHQLDKHILAYLKVNGQSLSENIQVPYNEDTDRYEVEIWGYHGNDLFDLLSLQGKEAFHLGQIIVKNDLIFGSKEDFAPEKTADKNIYEISANATIHPVLPLKIELAWADHTSVYWDSNSGKNYHYQFNMLIRGWQNFIQGGVSANPHGGIGFLHYRNLFSNYKAYSKTEELSRSVQPWMFDATGQKAADGNTKEEKSFTVDYMDLHLLKSDCSIGIHRHRDNQEIFFLLSGKALMVMGDWYEFDGRERAFEIRTMLPGDAALLKAGQLHALINALDIDSTLLMFGGYD